MRILVTGGGGQLADRVVAAGITSGHDMISLPIEEMDITDADQVQRGLGDTSPDLVFNAAGYTAVDRAENEEEAATRINGDGAGILAASCREIGARMVHISTDFVFPGSATSPIRPYDTVEPISAYGRSKAIGEQRCVEVLGDSCLILRTAWLYGSGRSNFVATMIRLMRAQSEIAVVADQTGTPTWVETLAVNSLRLVDRNASGMHHLTDSGVATWYEFAVAIRDIAGEIGLISSSCDVVPIETSEYPTPAQRPSYSVLDKSSTFEMLGDSTPHWRTSLRRCLEDWSDPQS